MHPLDGELKVWVQGIHVSENAIDGMGWTRSYDIVHVSLEDLCKFNLLGVLCCSDIWCWVLTSIACPTVRAGHLLHLRNL